jgi:hypothetical protein
MNTWLDELQQNLQAVLLLLLGMGLLLASYFLHTGLITGDNWSTVTVGLFGSGAIGGSIAQFGKRKD